MRFTYDERADAAYVYLREHRPGEKWQSWPVDFEAETSTRPMVVLDFDAERRLVGIEIVGALSGLPLDELLKDVTARRPPPGQLPG